MLCPVQAVNVKYIPPTPEVPSNARTDIASGQRYEGRSFHSTSLLRHRHSGFNCGPSLGWVLTDYSFNLLHQSLFPV